MPELPEAETLVRGLRPHVIGETIGRTRVFRPDLIRIPARAFGRELSGRRITSIERRAKNIVVLLDGGERRLVVNLGMTGGLYPLGFDPEITRPSHIGVQFYFDAGRSLAFRDIRRFGRLEVFDPAGWAEREAQFGPEPLDRRYTASHMHAALLKSRTPLRNWLLDQRRIAGVGNIYANEAGFLAGVHPARRACDVTGPEAELLHRGVRDVLKAAINRGGTTLKDYRDVRGEEGEYGGQLKIYGRDGEPCLKCGDTVERMVISNRSAFFCPTCQS